MNNIIRLIILLFSFISIIVIIVLTEKLLKNNPLKYNDKKLVIPSTSEEVKSCLTNRVVCDPKNPNMGCGPTRCSEAGTVELECVNLDAINSNSEKAKEINGGGYVCLPSITNKPCIKENGGVYVWTGYGGTEDDNQAWQCTCTLPDIYGNPNNGCRDLNPGYCSDGNLSVDKNDKIECNCPLDKVKMFRSSDNSPFCANKNLSGNYAKYPNWINCLFRLGAKDDNGTADDETLNSWSDRIMRSICKTTPSIENIIRKSILNSIPKDTSNNKIKVLSKSLADNICKSICQSSPDGSNYITPSTCNCNGALNFPDIKNLKVSYTYYPDSYLP